MRGKATELGKKFYEEHLKPILEPQENGKLVAIEPESREYFIGTTAVEALKKGNTIVSRKDSLSGKNWVSDCLQNRRLWLQQKHQVRLMNCVNLAFLSSLKTAKMLSF